MPFEQIEHTADIGIRATGNSLDEAFDEAAAGMLSIISDLSEIEEIGEYEVYLEADDLEQLLVDWLSELLFLFDAQELLFKSFNVKLAGNTLTAILKGEKLDREKHPLHIDIKAVTYHMIEVNKETNTVQVLFDI